MTPQTLSRSGPFREPAGVLPNTLVLLWASVGWFSSFILMGAPGVLSNVVGVLLCCHAMVIAAYLIHEAAHQTLFVSASANRYAGEWLGFVAGSSYASFERIRRMHIRHHCDRVDLISYDFKGLLRRRLAVRRLLEIAEWAYVPATEILLHLQILWRPLLEPGQRRYLPRVLGMLLFRSLLLAALALWSLKALVLYLLAYGLLLHVLNFFDAFHHSFDQIVVDTDQEVPKQGRDRAYEQANTYSNLISARWPWLNVLTLNFGYHNAHHERPGTPWYRLPSLHRSLYGGGVQAVLPLSELMLTWHRNRVRRVHVDSYGVPGATGRRADSFIGTHGVSFLTVV
jgi:fatty acid desaturase